MGLFGVVWNIHTNHEPFKQCYKEDPLPEVYKSLMNTLPVQWSKSNCTQPLPNAIGNILSQQQQNINFVHLQVFIVFFYQVRYRKKMVSPISEKVWLHLNFLKMSNLTK